MKRFTFVYKLNIYFDRDVQSRSVKLTQPKLNTEEIICSSGVGHCVVFAWKLECCFESTVYTFLRLLDLFAFMS